MKDPGSLNHYSYCGGNPVMNFDPTGHSFVFVPKYDEDNSNVEMLIWSEYGMDVTIVGEDNDPNIIYYKKYDIDPRKSKGDSGSGNTATDDDVDFSVNLDDLFAAFDNVKKAAESLVNVKANAAECKNTVATLTKQLADETLALNGAIAAVAGLAAAIVAIAPIPGIDIGDAALSAEEAYTITLEATLASTVAELSAELAAETSTAASADAAVMKAQSDYDNAEKTFNGLGAKTEKYLAKRNWNWDDVEDTVKNPYTTRAARNKANGNPATAYYDKAGHYVVRDNITGDLVQLSDYNKLDWIPDSTIVDPYKP